MDKEQSHVEQYCWMDSFATIVEKNNPEPTALKVITFYD